MLIQAYKQSWIADFGEISNVIYEALINLNISIEHIGSTSVPELAAKPIIDIDIIIDNYKSFDEVKPALENLGYYHNGNQGVADREVFKRNKPENHQILDSIIHHLYVCPKNSEELRRHILFRDYLIANKDARIKYQKLKYKIAAEAAQDKKTYAELKEIKATEFIAGVTAKAANRFC
jgi:GrpB-like predicted nucleotidyltransferase (UPF0157 family)